MENEQYIVGMSSRVDGYFAVIKRESDNEKVFELKCDNADEALQVAMREWHKMQNK